MRYWQIGQTSFLSRKRQESKTTYYCIWQDFYFILFCSWILLQNESHLDTESMPLIDKMLAAVYDLGAFRTDYVSFIRLDVQVQYRIDQSLVFRQLGQT
jgi:hypothetical protein